MRTRSKLYLVALGATLALGLGVTVAHAGRGQLTNGEANFVIKWSPLEINVGELSVSCNILLEGSFSATTYSKTAEATIGSVIEATAESCSGGRATILTGSLPWTIAYSSFTGTLPSITGIGVKLVRAGVQIEPSGLGVACLMSTEARAPARGTGSIRREASGGLEIPVIQTEASARIGLTGGFLCTGVSATLGGEGTELEGTNHAIVTVRLI